MVWELVREFFYGSIEKARLLHGDLSLDNILVSSCHQKICVVDYGLTVTLEPSIVRDILSCDAPTKTAKRLHDTWHKKGYGYRAIDETWVERPTERL